jgi:hypothetical protein
MARTSVVNKMLAIAGTVLAWLPIVAPLVFAFIALFTRGRFLFDYLMPAEVFPVALAGGVLLLVAAFRMQSRRGLVGGALALAVFMLFGFQALAMALGLASGEQQPEGWRLALVLAGVAVYILALAAVGVGGILLLRQLFGRQKLAEKTV